MTQFFGVGYCDKTVWFECECEWLEAAKWWDSLEVTIQSKSDDLLCPRGHEVSD